MEGFQMAKKRKTKTLKKGKKLSGAKTLKSSPYQP